MSKDDFAAALHAHQAKTITRDLGGLRWGNKRLSEDVEHRDKKIAQLIKLNKRLMRCMNLGSRVDEARMSSIPPSFFMPFKDSADREKRLVPIEAFQFLVRYNISHRTVFFAPTFSLDVVTANSKPVYMNVRLG